MSSNNGRDGVVGVKRRAVKAKSRRLAIWLQSPNLVMCPKIGGGGARDLYQSSWLLVWVGKWLGLEWTKCGAEFGSIPQIEDGTGRSFEVGSTFKPTMGWMSI